ncbi:flavodoxin [Enterobacter hormaechei]|nr:flavodoxin [Enterobacter hormaechei]
MPGRRRGLHKKESSFRSFQCSESRLKNLAQPSQQEEGYPPFAGGLILSQQERDMANIGIFFGSDTGKTRKIAKLIQQKLGDVADAPVNINRTSLETFLSYPVLVLGTPTLGDGQLPGFAAGCESESWGEFIDQLADANLSGKIVALYGLGDQQGYPDNFASALRPLYDAVVGCGAQVVGEWPGDGYDFSFSAALEGDKFVGLVLDQDNQFDLTDERVASWLEQIKPQIL